MAPPAPGGEALSDGAILPRMDVKALSEVALTDADGAEHRLGDFWDSQRVVLVFLRHFG